MAIHSIKLVGDGTVFRVDVGNHKLSVSDEVLLETQHGMEVGYLVPCGGTVEEGEQTVETNEAVTFIRKLNETDNTRVEKLAEQAKEYISECKKKIEKFSLPMELLGANLSYDEKKITFYFTAPTRVDFRLLVSDLAHTFKKIIRLQQVGARDEARYLGGIGRCGEALCCKRFLKGNLESVTLDMAADQNLAQMGSNRVTGVCGKLMCCLKYELEEYREAKKKMPQIGTEVKTKDGRATVISHNVLKNSYNAKIIESGNVVEVEC